MMKKLLMLALALVLTLGMAQAATPDLSGCSYEELVAIRDEAERLIRERDVEWAKENGNRRITLNDADVFVGKKIKLNPTLERVTEDAPQKTTLKWETSDPAVAKVGKDGTVTGVAEGIAVITVSAADDARITASAVVQVAVPVKSVKLPKTLTLGVGGGIQQLICEIQPANATCRTPVWSSSDENVAIVDAAGWVTGVGPGTAVITARCNEPALDPQNQRSASCTVTVYQSVTGVFLNAETLTVQKGGKTSLLADYVPQSASCVNLTWDTSDKSVAQVADGVVTGKKGGTAIITVTATSADGAAVTASCTVNVYVPASFISMSQSSVDLLTGDTHQAQLTLKPADATSPLRWTSSDEGVATVDASGLVTARGAGQAVIRVETQDDTLPMVLGASMVVNVKEPLPVQVTILDGGDDHTVGLRPNGTVVATGDNEDGQCNVASWKDIVSISAGLYHTVGLKNDGTVVATGMKDDKQCAVDKWKNVVDIAAGSQHTLALTRDGQVLVTGDNEHGQLNVKGWTDVVDVAAGSWHSLGITSDGRVLAAGYNEFGQCNVSSWRDIVKVVGDHWLTVGLKKDGTVVYAGGYDSDERREYNNCLKWTGIVDIAIGRDSIMGLRADGTLVYTCASRWGIANAADVASIAGGGEHMLALKADGSVMGSGVADYYKSATSWKLQTPPQKEVKVIPAADITPEMLLNPKVINKDVTLQGVTYKAYGMGDDVRSDNKVGMWGAGTSAEDMCILIFDPTRGVLNYGGNHNGKNYNVFFSYREVFTGYQVDNVAQAVYHDPAEAPWNWLDVELQGDVLVIREVSK